MNKSCRFFPALLLCLVALSHQASAAKEDFVAELKTCQAVGSLVQRSQCYDVVLDEYDLATLNKKEATGSIQGWVLKTAPSTLANLNNVSLSVDSETRITNDSGVLIHPTLTLRCDDAVPSSYINWGTNMSDNPTIVVNTQVGVNPIVGERWTVSKDKSSTFIANTKEFSQTLLNQNKYVVTAFADKRQIATFDIQNLADKYAALKAACKW